MFPEHIMPDTSTVSEAEYMVKVRQWLKDRPSEDQPSTESKAVSAYVIDDRHGTLSKAWRDRELAKQDLRLTPGQMKWLKDKAPKCPIKYDHTDLLVKPSASAGFDEDALRTYVVHELSMMPALAQVCNGITKFCLTDISRPCIKCPFTRELIPLGRALVPPYNEINRELKDTCGKAAASAFAKFIKDSVPAADSTFRGDLELLCTKHNLTPDMFVDHTSGGKEPKDVIVILSDDEHSTAAATAPKAKRRRVSYPKWLAVGQTLEYTGTGYRSSWPLKQRLCRVIKTDGPNITFEFLSDGAQLHSIKANRIVRPIQQMNPVIQKILDSMSDSDDDNQAGPAL